jgi:hypothetical protein
MWRAMNPTSQPPFTWGYTPKQKAFGVDVGRQVTRRY